MWASSPLAEGVFMAANQLRVSRSQPTRRSTNGWKRTWTSMPERSLKAKKRSSKLAGVSSIKFFKWPVARKLKANSLGWVTKSSLPGYWDPHFRILRLQLFERYDPAPKIRRSPNSLAQRFELHHLAMVHKQIHLGSEVFDIPAKHGRVGSFEHHMVQPQRVCKLRRHICTPALHAFS